MSIDAALASPSAKGRGTRGKEAPFVGLRGEAGRLPNFLVIGGSPKRYDDAPLCLGAASRDLRQPEEGDQFLPVRRVRRAAPWVNADTRRAIPRTLEQYAALFEDATEQHAAVGESSPGYLHGPVARRIKADLPDARLIVILRQPVEQALSIYATWQGGDTPAGGLIEPFLAALADDAPDRTVTCRSPARPRSPPPRALLRPVRAQPDQGHAARHLEREGVAYFRDLFRFLGVDDSSGSTASSASTGRGSRATRPSIGCCPAAP